MNAKEQEAWLKRNAPIKGKLFSQTGQSERFPPNVELTSLHLQERHSYPETLDLREPLDEEELEEEESSQEETPTHQEKPSKKERADSTAKKQTAKSIGKVAARVVAVAGGTVTVVSGYQAIQAQEASRPALVAIATWTWGDDNLSAYARLYDSEDIYLKQLTAVIQHEHTLDATCTADGEDIYIAKVTDEDGSEYSDQHVVVLPALGHLLDEGTVTVLENGDTVITYECTRCHEEMVITISGTEEEN